MFAEKHAFPVAVVSQDDESVVKGFKWAIDHKRSDATSEGMTVWAHGQQNFRNNALVEQLTRRPGVHTMTARGHDIVPVRGPLIMAWADPTDIGAALRFGDHKVTALLVIGWVTERLYPWAHFAEAEFMGNLDLWHSHEVHIDPVVERVMEGTTALVNHNNTILAGVEKDWTVGPLLELHDHGYALDEDILVGWAVANGWKGDNPKHLREYIQKINAGKRPRVSRGSGRRGVVAHAEAEVAEQGE